MTDTIRVKIEELNSNKIVNGLIENGVILKNLKDKFKFVLFDIDKKNQKTLDEICKKFHKKYEIVYKNFFLNSFLKLKYCFGFVFALVLISSFLFSFNMYVFEVNLLVQNNAKFDTKPIEQILKDNGVFEGGKNRNIDMRKVQDLIVASQENIAGCSIKKQGGKIDVLIYPSVMKEDKTTGNRFSKYDAVVSRVNIFAGKSNVKVGDFVESNELLIENDNGADGEIFGKVYFSDYLIYNENQTKKVKTGKVIKKTDVLIFGNNLSKQKKFVEFSNYFEENCVFYITKNVFLPISLKKTAYHEFELVEEKIEFEKVENELKEKLYNSVLEKLPNKDSITNVTFSAVKENNFTRLDCFVECELDLLN